MSEFDLVVIGGGPAGLAAAVQAREFGLSVALIDEQPQPGGQIYRAVERTHAQGRDKALGEEYCYGLGVVHAFRACGATYLAAHQVWQVETDGRIFVSHDGHTRCIRGQRVVIAVGAMERPVPIPGWTLPGVMTVGAAQIMLKTAGMLPNDRVWIAGSGPLLLAYASQVVANGGQLAGILDTGRVPRWRAGLAHLGGALRGWRYILKGLHYEGILRRAKLRIVKGVHAVEAQGGARLQTVRWKVDGSWHSAPAESLLLHEGVIPHTHMTQSLGCEHRWDDTQKCMRPVVDAFGRTSWEKIYVAGDCGGIGGARAAEQQGRLAAIGAWASLAGQAAVARRDALAEPVRRELVSHLAIRGLLDELFVPRLELLEPAADVVVCRCEGVTAGALREAVAIGCRGPNQAKSFTRCGMGPCQGRLCGPTVSNVIAGALNVSPEQVGVLRVRPPLKPLTLGELAGAAQESDAVGSVWTR